MRTKRARDRTYETSNRPQPASERRAKLAEVGSEPVDHEDERTTAEVLPSRQEDARPARRKFHPLWLIIPLAIAILVLALVWGGAYVIEFLGLQS